MSTSNRKLQVFLCHASQNKSVVRELNRQLAEEGWIAPWLDEEKLLPGQDWDIEIEKAVEAADAVIVCLSSTSVKKEGYIQKELRSVINIALEKPPEIIFIIPLRLDECAIPRNIKHLHYFDYFPSDKTTTAYNRLLGSLEARANVLGIGIEETREYFQKEAEEKAKRELEESIRKEERKKILRQEAQERVRLITKENLRNPAKERKNKAVEEKREEYEQKEVNQTHYSSNAIDEPHKNNAPLGVGIITVVLLFSCCFISYIFWNYGDAIIKALGG